MKIEKKEKETLRLAHEGGKPVMKMEKDGAKMTFYFADAPSVIDVKKVIVDLLTSRTYLRNEFYLPSILRGLALSDTCVFPKGSDLSTQKCRLRDTNAC